MNNMPGYNGLKGHLKQLESYIKKGLISILRIQRQKPIRKFLHIQVYMEKRHGKMRRLIKRCLLIKMIIMIKTSMIK